MSKSPEDVCQEALDCITKHVEQLTAKQTPYTKDDATTLTTYVKLLSGLSPDGHEEEISDAELIAKVNAMKDQSQ